MAEIPANVSMRAFAAGRQRCDISADVRSSSGIAEHFHTYLATDPEMETIVDYECNCPAARKNSGMCKHCVALSIAFKDNPSSFDGFAGHDAVRTSFSLREFMSKAPKGSDLRIGKGDAHLAPTLIHAFGQWSLRLEIEAWSMTYVISDIAEFALAVKNESFFSYGKRLAFVHEMSAFDEESRHVAEVVCARIDEGARAKRELDLKDDDVARILHGLGEEPFKFVDGEYGDEAASMHVRNEDPDITIRIIEIEQDAYEIVRDERMIVVLAAGMVFVFMDGAAYRCSQKFSKCAGFLKEVYCSERDDNILLSAEDAPMFCSDVLTVIEDAINVSIPSSLDDLRPREAKFSFYLDKVGRGKNERIECRLSVDYGQGGRDLLYPLTDAEAKRGDDAEGGRIKRDGDASSKDSYADEEKEDVAISLVFEYFDPSLSIPLEDEEAAGALLYTGLARFRQIGEIFTTPAFDNLLTDKKATVQIGLSLSGDLIDMDVHSSDLSKAELASLLKAYRLKKRYHRLSDGSIASLEDMNLDYLDRLASDFGLKPADLSKANIELPTYSAFILDREYSHAHRDASFDDYIKRFDNDSGICADAPAGLETALRDYQLEGLNWFCRLSSIGFGGILADEMGLGKTLQAIAYLLWAKEMGAGTCLVVCPASLVYNWTEEMRRFAPSLRCVAIDGPRVQRMQRREHADGAIMIASYDAVRMDVERFSEYDFSCIILDEAQYIKNHATKTTRAVKRLNGASRFALTGTPIENRLSEIWSIFDFLMPGFLGTYAQFRTRFEADIIGGSEEATSHFQALISPFVLRRLKGDVLTELPDKQESVVYVNLEGEQRRLYDACEQELREDLVAKRKAAKMDRVSGKPKGDSSNLKVEVLAELMRLREIALEPSLIYENYHEGSAKTAAVMELIGEARQSGKKALVFSQFTSYLDILKKRLDEEGVAFYEITGETSKKARIDLVNEFNDNDIPVFLISLKAGGTGLNLIGASIVIHADPWWNAAAIEQATDRAHRIGQTQKVSVYKVIAKSTIEERILRLQQKKTELASSVVSKNSLSALSSLSREELESLLFD